MTPKTPNHKPNKNKTIGNKAQEVRKPTDFGSPSGENQLCKCGHEKECHNEFGCDYPITNEFGEEDDCSCPHFLPQDNHTPHLQEKSKPDSSEEIGASGRPTSKTETEKEIEILVDLLYKKLTDEDINILEKYYAKAKLEGYNLAKSQLEKQLNDLQEAYNIAMKEISKLRKELGYDK